MGNIVVEYVYSAWGNHKTMVLDNKGIDMVDWDKQPKGDDDSAPNPLYQELSQLNPFRYRGYYYDSETGLYFLKTRYYDPEIGRFITIDDLAYLDPETINGLNLYAYCGNNPVMRTDSNGTNWWTDFWNGLGGAIVKVVLGVAIVVGLGIATVLTGGAVGAIVGAAFVGAALAGVSSCAIAIATGQSFTDFASSFLSGVIVGGISGAISGIGAPVGGGLLVSVAKSFVQNTLFQMGANALLGGSYYIISSLINGESIRLSNLMFSTVVSGLGALIPGGYRGAVVSVAVDYLSSLAEDWLSKLPF